MAHHGTAIPTRLVICVDGAQHSISSGTNVHRIYSSVKQGRVGEQTSKKPAFNQVVRFFDGLGSANDSTFSTDRLLPAAVSGQTYLKKIEDVYDSCCRLYGPDDEVWFLGFGRGAFVVRAVAGLLHRFGALASAGHPEYEKDFKKLMRDCERLPGSSRSSIAALTQVSSVSSKGFRPSPRIRFVGIFDTIKLGHSSDAAFDISFNPSIMHLRHALALHEDRKAFTPEYIFPEEFYRVDLRQENRSCIQAWFIGNHGDLGGLADNHGLALYPLQWMLLEAMECGLYLDLLILEEENPLGLVFPSLVKNRRKKEENLRQWSCKTANEIEIAMQDIRDVQSESSVKKNGKNDKKKNNQNRVRLNTHIGTLRLRKARETFTPEGRLRGYCDSAPQGTIIHPSVYLLLDGHVTISLETKELKLQRYIEDWRERMLGVGRSGLVNQGFWIGGDEEDEDIDIDAGAIRVLVCGNTGVGKSTLINKIFGVDVTQSSNRMRGIHDVREEIVFEGRPDLVVHDSGGFEAGADDEFKRIEQFLKDKSAAQNVRDRLHVIWFCIDINSPRTLQTATEKLFRAVSEFAEEVPIVVVATKKDDFLDIEFGAHRKAMKKEGKRFDEEACEQYAEGKLQDRIELIRSEMQSVPGGRLDACLAVSKEDDESIKELSKTTSRCFDTDKVRLLYVRAQVSRIDLKIDMALCEVTRRYKRLIASTTGSAFVPMASTVNRKASTNAVTKSIITCFGLPSVSADAAINALSSNVWSTLGSNVAFGVAESLSIVGVLGSVATMGIPVWLVAGAINAPVLIPATCRLFLIMAIDLTLVLARSFKEVTFRASGQPCVRDVAAAARNYKIRGYSQHVHRDIKKLVPRRNIVASYKAGTVQSGVEGIVAKYKDGLMEDVDLPLQVGGMRLDRTESMSTTSDGVSSLGDDENDSTLYDDLKEAQAALVELDSTPESRPVLPELEASTSIAELPADYVVRPKSRQSIKELEA